MEKEELRTVLEQHKLWLNGEGGKRANLRDAHLRYANLRDADLWGADLRYADLGDAHLREADLMAADLWGADLRDADFRYANLRAADLREADLREADLSGAKGLLSQSEWMEKNFEDDGMGYIVYKRIGQTQYDVPDYWTIAPGEYIEEVCNPGRTVGCACGVNFGTREWVNENYTEADIWKCRVEYRDLPGVVVPYNTDGKARCERLLLIEKE